MTLPQVQELLDYWRGHPPVHLLVAAALGVEEKRRAEDFAALIGLAPNGILAAKGRN